MAELKENIFLINKIFVIVAVIFLFYSICQDFINKYKTIVKYYSSLVSWMMH